jgi:type IV pilus assembly protein PilC
MALFNYVATSKTSGSKTITGSVEARNREDAMAALVKQRLNPVSITAAKESSGLSFLGAFFKKSKVKPDELVLFTRQLSAMVGAGVPLLRALNSMQAYTDSAAFSKVLAQVASDIEGGASFADALGKHPATFNDVYTNMVRAGEAAGILDDILKRLALEQEKSATIRKKIKSAMSYPMVLIGITVLAFFGLMLFVIPQIGKIITDLGGPDAKLPILTQIMLGISAFIINYWWLVFPAIGAGIFFLLRYIKTPVGKRQFHALVIKMPVIKTILRKIAVARFARTYSSLIGAGVSVIEALSVSARAIGNTVYEDSIKKASDRVKNGEQLSSVLAEDTNLFPPILSQMLAVGEETGQTDTILVKVADFYEEEVDVAIDSISSIIEPVMIVVMGSMVGVIAASVMQPIASLSQNIQG